MFIVHCCYFIVRIDTGGLSMGPSDKYLTRKLSFESPGSQTSTQDCDTVVTSYLHFVDRKAQSLNKVSY